MVIEKVTSEGSNKGKTYHLIDGRIFGKFRVEKLVESIMPAETAKVFEELDRNGSVTLKVNAAIATSADSEKGEENMLNMPQIFTSEEFGEVRMRTDGTGTVWINVEDSARGLGFTQTKNGVEYVRWETVNAYLVDVGFSQKVGKDDYIPENIFYRLAMKAKNAAAEAFQNWIASKVIPSIRRTGSYSVVGAPAFNGLKIDSAFMMQVATKMKELEEANAALEATVAELTPKATYTDNVLACRGSIKVTDIAQDYGMTPEAFNQLLYRMHIQHKVGGTWILYKPYLDKGWVTSHTYYFDRNGETGTRIHTYWTQRGRYKLYELLKESGVVPLSERMPVTLA